MKSACAAYGAPLCLSLPFLRGKGSASAAGISTSANITNDWPRAPFTKAMRWRRRREGVTPASRILLLECRRGSISRDLYPPPAVDVRRVPRMLSLLGRSPEALSRYQLFLSVKWIPSPKGLRTSVIGVYNAL